MNKELQERIDKRVREGHEYIEKFYDMKPTKYQSKYMRKRILSNNKKFKDKM